MAEKQHYLTTEGRRKLREELHYLINTRRHEVADQIKFAKEGGDVSENAGYDEAKNAQAFLEGRIMTIENILKTAVIIGNEGPTDSVSVGAYVTVSEDGQGQEQYQIVGSAEANPSQGRISNESPLGKELLGKKVGEKIDVKTPGGTRKFVIASINWTPM